MQQWRPEIPAMSFDDVSMERSKSFVKTLQELKNLRPQLYSAAEYCEKSYLHNEQKQMVLDNLKDYAVRALVNAVDHLGTVAYKLTDLFEQQILDVSTTELKISCLNQQILTCQIYMDKEGLRQQQLLTISPRHHKHYILPNSVNKNLHSTPPVQVDAKQNHIQAKPRPRPPGTPASKTLSWHLASEGNSASNGTLNAPISNEDTKASNATSQLLNLLDAEGTILPYPQSTSLQKPTGTTSDVGFHTFGAGGRGDISKSLAAFKSFDNPRREICRPPVRSKSMLAAFFAKNKYVKQKKALVL